MTYAYRAGRLISHNPAGRAIPLNDEYSRLHTLNKRIQRVQWWVLALSNFCLFGGLISMRLSTYADSLRHEKEELQADIKEKFKNLDKGIPGIFKGLNLTKAITEELVEENFYDAKTGTFRTEDAILHQIQKDFDRPPISSFYNGEEIFSAEQLASVCSSHVILELSHQGACEPATRLLVHELQPKIDCVVNGFRGATEDLRPAKFAIATIDTIFKQTVTVTSFFKPLRPVGDGVYYDLQIRAVTVYDLQEKTQTTTFEPYFGE